MKYLGTILVAYIVLFILDIMQKRNHKTTKSLNKFSIRTISDVSFICAIGALLLESDRNSHPKTSRINQSESDRNSQS